MKRAYDTVLSPARAPEPVSHRHDEPPPLEGAITYHPPAEIAPVEVGSAETTVDASEWDQYLSRAHGAVHYHRYAWRSVIARTYKIATRYLVARRSGCIVGVLPLAYMPAFPFAPHVVSLPYLSYAGVCADDAQGAAALVREANLWAQTLGARYLELHDMAPLGESDSGQLVAPSHEREGYSDSRLVTQLDKVRMVLELPRDSDALWRVLDPKVRNQVRKAMKSGLRTQIGGPELLASFYAIFAENMRDLGSPVHSRNLFAHAIEAFGESIRIFMVYKDAIPVAGAYYLWHGDQAEVPWASARREFRALCPNNLIYWSVLKHACEQGMKAFDFGRSTRDSGTYKFKQQWGATPQPLYWHYVLGRDAQAPDATHSSSKARLLVEAWKRLPLSIANALGPRVRGRISA